jgi:hypothetical protein
MTAMNHPSKLFRRQFLGAACAPLIMAQSTPPEREHGAVPFGYFRGRPLRIGTEVQFLADDYLVEDRWKLTRRQDQVAKHLRNPVVVQDKPWEEQVGCPCVLYDEKIGKYRMWFQCFSLSNYYSRHLGPAY